MKQSIGIELGLQIDSFASSQTSYHVTGSRVLLHNSDEDGTEKQFSGIGPEEPCSELFQMIESGDEANELKTRRKIKDYSQVSFPHLNCVL